MTSDYESDDNLRIDMRCLPALAMVPSTDVAKALFQCHHPALWTFMVGLEKDMQMQHATFVHGVSGLQPFIPKR